MDNESLGQGPDSLSAAQIPARWLLGLAAVGVVAVFIAAAVALFYTVDWACRAFRGPLVLRDRVALVTGAGSGIGQALAIELARRGCHLVLWDLRWQALQDTARLCRLAAATAGRRGTGTVNTTSSTTPLLCVTQVLDVSNPDLVDRAMADLPRQLVHRGRQRRVTVVVNNCGIVFGKQLQQLTAREMQRTLAVNVFAPMWILRKFLPLLLARRTGTPTPTPAGEGDPLHASSSGGESADQDGDGANNEDDVCIVNMSSLMGSLGAAGLTDYCASKWAVNGMHECLRQELAAEAHVGGAGGRAARRVHTLLVSPYIVNTGMFRGAMEKDSVYCWHKWLFPALKREDVAAAIARALEARRGLLVLPRHLTLVPPLLHLLPQPMYDFVVGLTGGRTGLRHFAGRHASWNLPPADSVPSLRSGKAEPAGARRAVKSE